VGLGVDLTPVPSPNGEGSLSGDGAALFKQVWASLHLALREAPKGVLREGAFSPANDIILEAVILNFPAMQGRLLWRQDRSCPFSLRRIHAREYFASR
jgi:hypothetical protein